jgi:hypothetical protein
VQTARFNSQLIISLEAGKPQEGKKKKKKKHQGLTREIVFVEKF